MSIKYQVVHSVKWNVIAVVYKIIMQLLRISILARFLTLSDFGLIAIALMFVSFTDIFVDLGFTVPIIHKQNISQKEYSSVFWMNVIMSVFIYFILFLSAPLIADFYNNESLNNIVRVISIVVIINAFGKVFQTIRTKNLDFRFISIVSMISSTIGLISILVFAIMGWGIYSLVYGTIIETILRQGTYFIKGLTSNRILFHLNLCEIRDYFRIGGYQIGAQILDFLANKIDIIIIGKLIDLDSLGIYNLAKELVIKCYGIGTSLTRNVFTAALAKIQNDMDKYRTIYNQYVEKYSYMMILAYALLFFLSRDICVLMYGEKAFTIVPILRVLIIYGISISLISSMASVQLSLGRTDIALEWTFILSILTLIFILIGGYGGLVGIVISESALAILSFFLCWKLVLKKLLGFNYRTFFSSYSHPIYMGIISFITASIPFILINQPTVAGIISSILFLLVYAILVITNDSILKNKLFEIWAR